jgi:hypothetical protein
MNKYNKLSNIGISKYQLLIILFFFFQIHSLPGLDEPNLKKLYSANTDEVPTLTKTQDQTYE